MMQRRGRIYQGTVTIIGALCFFVAGAGSADTLTITYRSGKTQQITLEEGAESVQDIRLQTASGAKDEGVRYLCAKEAEEPTPRSEEQRAPEDKKKIKFRWGTPKVGE